jgi:hypothetical protein
MHSRSSDAGRWPETRPVDEGTAIYKVANATPVGKYVATYEGLPADW